MIFGPKRDAQRILRMEWRFWLILSVMGVIYLEATGPSFWSGASLAPPIAVAAVIVPLLSFFYRLYATSYSLTDDLLIVRVGLLEWRIPLAYVESVYHMAAPGDALVWSNACLQIRYRCRPEVSDEVYIAPRTFEPFLRELRALAPWLESDGSDLMRRIPILEPEEESEPDAKEPVREPPAGGNHTKLFPVRRDVDYVSETAYVPALVLAGIWWMPLGHNSAGASAWTTWMSIGMGVVFVAAIIPVVARLLFVRYELAENELIVRFGFRRATIPYSQICEVYPVHHTHQHLRGREPVANLSWSWNALQIDAETEDELNLQSIRIAPRYREEFLNALGGLSPHLTRRGDVLYDSTRT